MDLLHNSSWQFIITLLHDPLIPVILGIISLFVSIIGIYVSIVIYEKWRSEKGLSYELISNTPISSIKEEAEILVNPLCKFPCEKKAHEVYYPQTIC